MDYKEIAEEILEDVELQKKYGLSESSSIYDQKEIIIALRKIIEEKNKHRTEKSQSTAKISRELNILFNI